MFNTAMVAQEDAPVAEPQKHPVHTLQPQKVAEPTLFQDEFIVENVIAVHHRGAALTAGERYEFLAAWVLPGDDRATFRLACYFTATNPAPVVYNDVLFDRQRIGGAEFLSISRCRAGFANHGQPHRARTSQFDRNGRPAGMGELLWRGRRDSRQRDRPGPPQLLPGQPEGYKNYDADWSRDGKQIAFASQRPPTWEEWFGKMEPKSRDALKSTP